VDPGEVAGYVGAAVASGSLLLARIMNGKVDGRVTVLEVNRKHDHEAIAALTRALELEREQRVVSEGQLHEKSNAVAVAIGEVKGLLAARLPGP